MTAEILRHSEAIGYDAFVVPAMLLEAWVAERRNEPGAAKDAYRRALELAGRIGFADHVSFALVRLGSNALARGDTRQAEELCRRALAMAEAASTSRLAAHARVQLARVLEAAGDADTAETLYRRVVEWSQTPRPRQVHELLFVVLAGGPRGGGAAGPGAACGSPWGRRRGRRPGGPRRRDGSARPRLARRAARGGCGDLSDAPGRAALVGWVAARVEFREKLPDRSSGGVSGCRGSGPPRWRAASLRGGRGPATRRMLGVPWQCQPRPRQPHGSRVRQRG